MKRQVAIFIETGLAQLDLNFTRLELFNDEKITVSSTIQNISDISKIFTDYSQGFTIPCSPTNNAIFQHFYQNDVNATIDYQKRYNAYIEIDTVLFRRGKIQLEKTNLKNGSADSYSVTFYGAGVSLKDYFNEDKLSQLDHTSLNHNYINLEVYKRVTIDSSANDYDVRYPLITSKRIWQFNGSQPIPQDNCPEWFLYPTNNSDNIGNNAGKIEYQELFPAVRVASIFDLIESQYGITFNGLFLTSDMFRKAFLYYKNKEKFNFVTQPANVTFKIAGSSITETFLTTFPPATTPIPSPYTSFNTTNNTFNTIFVTPFLGGSNPATGLPVGYGTVTHSLRIVYNGASPVLSNCWLDVYKNGVYTQSLTVTPSLGLDYTIINLEQTPSNNVFYTFKLRSELAQTLEFQFRYVLEYQYWAAFTSGGQNSWQTYTATTIFYTNNVTTTSFTDLQGLAPDMKISDFITGICNEFNMTVYSKTKNVFTFEPIQDWYKKGAVIDITKFTDVTSIEVERLKLYKLIEFKYQDSQSFLNKYFLESPANLTAHGYGNAKENYPFDGGEYKIQSPFENLLHTNFGNQVQVAYCLNNEFAPYIPKPVLLYMNKLTTITGSDKIHWNGQANITDYVPFGQDSEILIQGGIFPLTLNFGVEISSFYNVENPNTLYALYYQSYLTNLYNPKNRLVKVKTVLPVSLLTQLQLNDRLIIRDKRYLINEMQSDLTTGDVDFTLINDFASVNPIVYGVSTPSGSVHSMAILFSNGATQVRVSKSANASNVTLSSVLFTNEGYLKITVPANSTRIITITLDSDYSNGNTETNYIIIEQK
jgi:hypothetical protein